ncbi:MAG: hypothetical protein SFW35_07750 [Chitinophagales bacterium]|nr:hypothetical protein [Chitinophagales bacterium]
MNKEIASYYRLALYLSVVVSAAILIVFTKSFWGRDAAVYNSPLVVQIHGFALFFWTIMFFLQPIFIRMGQIKAHRIVGAASKAIVPIIALTTVLSALNTYYHGHVVVPAPRAFSVLFSQIASVLVFCFLYAMAIYYVKVPLLHVKYILSTSFVLLGPVVFRSNLMWFRLDMINGIELTSRLLTFGVIDFVLLILLLFEKRKGFYKSPYFITLVLLAPNQFFDIIGVYERLYELLSKMF